MEEEESGRVVVTLAAEGKKVTREPGKALGSQPRPSVFILGQHGAIEGGAERAAVVSVCLWIWGGRAERKDTKAEALLKYSQVDGGQEGTFPE